MQMSLAFSPPAVTATPVGKRAAKPAAPGPVTVAAALRSLADDTALDDRQRRLFGTVLKNLCQLARKPADQVALHGLHSVALLERATPAELGIKASTLANRLAALRALLRHLGLLALQRQRVTAIVDPAWSALVAELPAGPDFGRLRAFAADCAALGVAPNDVSRATLDDFAARRGAERGGAKARDQARRIGVQWNQAARDVAVWPKAQLGLTDRVLQYSLPFEAYPETLQAEIGQYLDGIARPPNGALFSGKACRPVTAATVEARKYGVRRLLWGAVQAGRDAASITTLREFSNPDFVKSTLEWNHRHYDNEITVSLKQLADAVASLAHWLELPDAERQVLEGLLARIKLPARNGVTERNARLLDALKDPQTRACLLHLPLHLHREANRLWAGWTDRRGQAHSARPDEAAWLMATAVAIEILLHAPMRLKNLQHLRVGQELLLAKAGRSSWRGTILVDASDVKNGCGIEVPLGSQTIALLRAYQDQFRPVLPNANTPWLFPGQGEGSAPRHKGAFGQAITNAVHQYVGLRINPHAFRAIAGSLILEIDPHAIDDVRAVLGHATFDTALRYYRQQNMTGAAERLSATLAKARRGTRQQADARLLALSLATRRPGRRS